MLSIAQALKALAGRYYVPLLINDHVELALEAKADGVHLGQGDMPPAQARALLGEQAIIGQTAYTQDHFKSIKTDPAQCVDYAGTGPFYETKTKKGKPLLDADNAAAFRALVEISSVPIVGIGGITPNNAAPVIEAGAAGVAMMRAISEARTLPRLPVPLSTRFGRPALLVTQTRPVIEPLPDFPLKPSLNGFIKFRTPHFVREIILP